MIVVACKTCGRELRPWPLGHPLCAPKDWVYCITTKPECMLLKETGEVKA